MICWLVAELTKLWQTTSMNQIIEGLLLSFSSSTFLVKTICQNNSGGFSLLSPKRSGRPICPLDFGIFFMWCMSPRECNNNEGQRTWTSWMQATLVLVLLFFQCTVEAWMINIYYMPVVCTIYPTGWKYTQNLIKRPGSDWSNSRH